MAVIVWNGCMTKKEKAGSSWLTQTIVQKRQVKAAEFGAGLGLTVKVER